MPNDDYRIKTGFRSNRKRRKLQLKLGDSAVLALIDLWGAVADDASSGRLLGWDKEDIEISAGWDGQPGVFVDFLVKLQLLDFDHESGEYAIHDWQEHNTWAYHAKDRSERARAAACARWGKRAGGMPTACEADHQAHEGQSPPPQPAHIQDQDPAASHPDQIQAPPSPLNNMLSDEVVDVNDYIKMATNMAVKLKKIRSSATIFAAAIRRKIQNEGGSLTYERQKQLADWRNEQDASVYREKVIQQQHDMDNTDSKDLLREVDKGYDIFLALPTADKNAICQRLFGVNSEPEGLNSALTRSKIAHEMGLLSG